MTMVSQENHLIKGTRASLARFQLNYMDIIIAHRYYKLTPISKKLEELGD